MMLKTKRTILVALMFFILAGCLLFAGEKAMAADSENLSWGSTGPSVTQIQQALNSNGYWCGTADGIFGGKTQAAVIRFQSDAGIQVDGIAGPITKKALGIVSNSVSQSGSSSYRGKTLTMVATGYDSSYESNYPWYGNPSYTGLPLARGIIATDPDVIPMGTRLYVEGYGEGIAADQGGAIKGNRIDLFFDSHAEALDWGMRTVKVTILS